jgi:hypothetical protein
MNYGEVVSQISEYLVSHLIQDNVGSKSDIEFNSDLAIVFFNQMDSLLGEYLIHSNILMERIELNGLTFTSRMLVYYIDNGIHKSDELPDFCDKYINQAMFRSYNINKILK